MTSLADRLLAKVGKTRADVNPRSGVGQAFRRKGVERTPDFVRVLTLPRIDWREGASELADMLTDEFGRPAGKCNEDCICRGVGHMRLRPVQAASLAALHDFGGLFAPIVVGGGKTLVSFLSARVIDAKRPLCLVPAKLRGKTEAEWWKLSVHWKLPQIRVESYERLGRAENAKLLEQYRPDFIFADEAHRLKNTKAAVTRRVHRYLQSQWKDNKRVVVALASGTLTTQSIRDYWHLLRWTHGTDRMPLPREWAEMMEWASALDVLGSSVIRTAPGALSEFCTTKTPDLETVRDGYRKRIVETPGVVSTSTKHVGCSLLITGQDLPTLDKLAPHYERLRTEWQTPDGWDFSEAIELWRHARELVNGFFNVWDPRPPEEWMRKRKAWHRFVRVVLKHSRQYDTEFQVATACHQGKISPMVDGVDVYREWKTIKPTFEPNAIPVWVDDTTLRFAQKWLEEDAGICWVEHPCFGEKLAKMSGFPYYGRKGLNSKGEAIEDAKGPIIASVLANGEGRNLQRWNRNLVVSCPPNGKTIEQLLGRTHRDGQEADEVCYSFVIACKEQLDGFHKAVREAQFIEQTLGQPQKLVYADKDLGSFEEKRGPRW